jgi:hypothetical protein
MYAAPGIIIRATDMSAESAPPQETLAHKLQEAVVRDMLLSILQTPGGFEMDAFVPHSRRFISERWKAIAPK